MSTARVEAADIATTGGTRVARIILIAVGGLGTLLGLYILVTTVKPAGLFGLAVWLLGALVLHDGLLSPTLFVGQRLLHRVGARLSGFTLAIMQAALLVGGIITLVVVPEIWAQARGPRNDSVLNMPYGLHLFFAWVAITLLALILIIANRLRRAKRRPRIDEVVASPVEPTVTVDAAPAARSRRVVPIVLAAGVAALTVTLVVRAALKRQ